MEMVVGTIFGCACIIEEGFGDYYWLRFESS
uniref:Uncharacterized protein n=1 Tax=Rhizophora mucronata TaxID=61149 RepID=A0A2P2Q496_RHIMU